MKAQLLVSLSVSQPKTSDTIFIKLPLKFSCLKDKKVPQPGKNIILGKDPEISSKVAFFGVGKKFIPLMCYFWVYMMHHSFFMILQKLHVLEKSLSQVINENALSQSDCGIF